jgi:hypothetical protein
VRVKVHIGRGMEPISEVDRPSPSVINNYALTSDDVHAVAPLEMMGWSQRNQLRVGRRIPINRNTNKSVVGEAAQSKIWCKASRLAALWKKLHATKDVGDIFFLATLNECVRFDFLSMISRTFGDYVSASEHWLTLLPY